MIKKGLSFGVKTIRTERNKKLINMGLNMLY